MGRSYVLITPVGEPFNSHELPRQNFSLQYQNNIKQTSDENKPQELYGRQQEELLMRSWELKGKEIVYLTDRLL